MSALFFVIGFAVALFMLAFFSKRRFGLLGLALGAGALISANWTGTITPFIEQQGVVLISPPLSLVVATVLTLLPPILLMFSGPKYGDMFSRIIGSTAFSVLALAFLADSLMLGLVLDDTSTQVFKTFAQMQSIFVVVGLCAAVLDTMLYRPPKDKDKGKK